ncbi:MAG: UDP-2,3-diacylglucosamine diphosphatase [Burkholderiales bacterium]|nr:UDP-2,3-diacylglucosamine diphosphatase [Burkholderiales bacterium]MBH2017285.1 UDP-2,3-diacylglucosamine diphosphatase [Burkholderiales bacterium]
MGLPNFPGAHTLNAPPSWRCIDFISDLHLHEGLPRTTATLAQHLAHTPADAVFILGDLFEAWVGDDMRQEPHESHCLDILRRAASQRWLGIMVGNRDFLLGETFLKDCGAHRLPDPTVLSAFGERALLMHGDELCLADTAYLKFRNQVRQTPWQQAFLASPLSARLAQARQMRAASQAHQHQHTEALDADVDEATAALWMSASDCHILIHGHTHRPASQPFGQGVRHVLSDWDMDHGAPRAEVLRWQASGLSRISLA